MASSGIAAWQKYYQGRGDIETRMKSDSAAYDVNNITTRLGIIPAGTPVVVLHSSSYDPNTTVRFIKDDKEYTVKVKFDSIAKPGVRSSGAASLKPQAFNIGDRQYALSEYRNVILQSISGRKDLELHVKEYLDLLFRYHSGERGKMTHLIDHFKEFSGSIPLNDVNKDFGEVLGPVAIQSMQLLAPKGIRVTSAAKVYIPWRPNEPLMDYAIIVGDKTYSISAKSGTTTNVVKSNDIINLIGRDKVKLKRWSNTPEFKLLLTLQENTALEGPIRAVSMMYPALISPRAASMVNGNNTDMDLFKSFISRNTYLKGRKTPTINELMYECEKIIQQETRLGKINMNKIFSDAISGQVIYVKFELDMKGIGNWGVIASDNLQAANSHRIFMRSKNGYTRASDKMGIQV